MSDYSNILNNAAPLQRAQALLGHLTNTVLSAAAGIKRGTAAFVKRMQYHRMVSVLNESSDLQLANIGITRADIHRHASYLVDYEYNGL